MQARQQVGRGVAGARDELPLQIKARRQQRLQVAGKGLILVVHTHARSSGIARNQQAQHGAGAGATAARAGGLRQHRRLAPRVHALGPEQWCKGHQQGQRQTVGQVEA